MVVERLSACLGVLCLLVERLEREAESEELKKMRLKEGLGQSRFDPMLDTYTSTCHQAKLDPASKSHNNPSWRSRVVSWASRGRQGESQSMMVVAPIYKRGSVARVRGMYVGNGAGDLSAR
jgi:hypothetical protein